MAIIAILTQFLDQVPDVVFVLALLTSVAVQVVLIIDTLWD